MRRLQYGTSEYQVNLIQVTGCREKRSSRLGVLSEWTSLQELWDDVLQSLVKG